MPILLITLVYMYLNRTISVFYKFQWTFRFLAKPEMQHLNEYFSDRLVALHWLDNRAFEAQFLKLIWDHTEQASVPQSQT